MNTPERAGPAPQLAAPKVPNRPMGLFEFLRRVRDNAISIYPPAAFEARYSARQVGLHRFVLLNEPEMIQHVLVRHAERYSKGRLNQRILGPALGTGLLTAEGEVWRRRRRIMAPAFHHQRLAVLAEVMTDEAKRLLGRWRQLASDDGACDMAAEMMRLTMRIAARTLFSYDVGDDTDRLGAAITTLIEELGRPALADLLGLPEWLPRKRSGELRAALRVIDRTIYQVIGERRAAASPGDDLLGLLLQARDEESGETLSDRALRDELVTLFAAGHETTALALCWTWYLLALHPEVATRLHGELDQLLAGRAARFADLEALPYTRMVFEESMRLYPPAFSINRVALRDDQIGPLAVRRGTLVTMAPWVTHRNPRLWPAPLRFDPERFRPEAVAARHRYAYFPFGGGPRVCIGNSFALIEGRIVLATLAQHFAPQLRQGHPVVPQARVTLRPRHGMAMTLAAR